MLRRDHEIYVEFEWFKYCSNEKMARLSICGICLWVIDIKKWGHLLNRDDDIISASIVVCGYEIALTHHSFNKALVKMPEIK